MEITFYKLKPKNHPFPLLAWLIMIFQGNFSHMALGYESETGNHMIADVTSKGCRDMKEDIFFKKYKIVGFKKIKFEINRIEFLDWLEEFKGVNYDTLQIFGLALKVLGFITFNTIGKNYKNLTCNELILSFFERFRKIKVKDSDNWDLNMVWSLVSE